jgi:hypothetical protein
VAEWTTEQIIARIRGEADKQKVDPDLAVAVATQESYLNPNAKGDNGNSLGLFQLQPAAAIDVGVNPKFRHEPDVNIYGGVSYLKQKLAQAKGNVDEALRRYNGGGDPNYVQNVRRFFKPGVAEAADRPQAGTYSDADVQEALKALQAPQEPTGGTYTDADVQSAMKALGGTTGTAEAPAPPTARSTPEQDAAYRASVDQQEPGAAPQAAPAMATPPGASQAPQTPSPDPSATPGMRFQALPSITQLEPADRLRKTRDFERLNPDLQEEFLRSEEPTAGGLAVGGGPVAQSQPVTDPAALLAVGKRPPGWREGDPLPADARRPPTPTEAPVEEGITKPSTMIPLLMPGAGVKAVAPMLGKAGPLITRGARAAAEGLSQTAGWTAGRTAETGQVPSPGEIGKEAALNVATGGIVEIPAALRGAKNAVLRRTPGAQTLLNQQAVQEAEGLGKRVFNAQDKEVVGKAFDAVAATGEKLDIKPVRDIWKSLTPAEQRVATNELNKISSTFAGSLKTPTSTWDIGELQHLRSELGKASATKRTPETIDILQSLRGSIDEAIHNGMAKGSLPAAELVAAQKAWRKVMQAEELQGRVARYTKDSPNLKWQELNLAALNKELRGGGKKSTQRLVAGMDQTERQVLQQELGSLQRHYPFIRITPTAANVVNLASLVHAGGRVMSGDIGGALMSLTPVLMTAAISSPAIMSMFKRSIIEGKGQLSSHSIDALLNAIRHENEQPPGTVRVTPSGTP